MSNFENVTSLFLILISLSESLLHASSPILHCIKKKKQQKGLWGDRFKLMSKKKSKERKTLSFGAKKKNCFASSQDCYADKTGKSVYPTLRLAVPSLTDWVSEHITETVL